MNDIVVNKVQSIHRCVARAREEYRLAGDRFLEDQTHQDAAVLNVTRACELAIDLANHLIKTRKMGIPTRSTESFALLVARKAIPSQLEAKLARMVGFRNIAVHAYRDLNAEIVARVIQSDLDDLLTFTDCVLEFLRRDEP